MLSNLNFGRVLSRKTLSRALACTALIIISKTSCFAQVDTILMNNQKIACSVKEVTPDAVKYTYPG